MNANELKEYIINNNKISLILEKAGCHSIREYRNEYRAALPDKTNPTAVTVKKDTLFIAVNSSGLSFTGDIFMLIMRIKNVTFGRANKLIHEYLGLKYSFSQKAIEEELTSDILDVFTRHKGRTYCGNKCVETYGADICDEYTMLPHISWIREGITPKTCSKFHIAYAYDKKRIIIPHRYWCGCEGEYVGIVGRTTIQNYDLLGIPKYFGIKPFAKSLNVYGLAENYEGIQNAGYAVVFEAEKSVLKRDSRYDNTAVAIGCHSISEEQVKILIGLNVDIVIAFDEGIELNDIRKECEKFYGVRNVYYIYDKWGLLESKESPADKPNKKYNFMLKYKIKYDEKEHKEWVKESQKKN